MRDPRAAEGVVGDATSRIDKDLKAELRETAFDMWMACHSQQEIAEVIGYSEKAIREFLDSLRKRENGTDTEIPVSSPNAGLGNSDGREFDEEDGVPPTRSRTRRTDGRGRHAAKSHPLPEHGAIGRGRDRGDNITSSDRGTSQSYTLRSKETNEQ